MSAAAAAATPSVATASAMSVPKKGKEVWGPLLWHLLHALAELSDRKDIPLLWPRLMAHIAAVMPCEKCRQHLATVFRARPFLHITNPHLVTGARVQAQVRGELWRFHNEVNARLGKPAFGTSPADAAAVHATKGRARLLLEAQDCFEKLKTAWQPLVHTQIDPGLFSMWKGHVALMLALVAGGPT